MFSGDSISTKWSISVHPLFLNFRGKGTEAMDAIDHIAKYAIMVPIWGSVQLKWTVKKCDCFGLTRVRLWASDAFTRICVIELNIASSDRVTGWTPSINAMPMREIIPAIVSTFHADDAYDDTLMPAFRDHKVKTLTAEIHRFLDEFNPACADLIAPIRIPNCVDIDAIEQLNSSSSAHDRVVWDIFPVGCAVRVRNIFKYDIAVIIKYKVERELTGESLFYMWVWIEGVVCYGSMSNNIGELITPDIKYAITTIGNLSPLCVAVIADQLQASLSGDGAIALFAEDRDGMRGYVESLNINVTD